MRCHRFFLTDCPNARASHSRTGNQPQPENRKPLPRWGERTANRQQAPSGFQQSTTLKWRLAAQRQQASQLASSPSAAPGVAEAAASLPPIRIAFLPSLLRFGSDEPKATSTIPQPGSNIEPFTTKCRKVRNARQPRRLITRSKLWAQN